MKKLEEKGIQSRPIWGLNHLQKPYIDCQKYRIEKAQELLKTSLCLPSSSNLLGKNIKRVLEALK